MQTQAIRPSQKTFGWTKIQICWILSILSILSKKKYIPQSSIALFTGAVSALKSYQVVADVFLCSSVSRGEKNLVVEIPLQYLSPFWKSSKLLLHAWLSKSSCLKSALPRNRLGVSRSWNLKIVVQHIPWRLSYFHLSFQTPALCTGALKHNQSNCRRLRKLVAKTEWFWLSKIRKHLGSTYCWNSRSVCNKD